VQQQQQQQQQHSLWQGAILRLASTAAVCLAYLSDAAAAADLLDQLLVPPLQQLLAADTPAAATAEGAVGTQAGSTQGPFALSLLSAVLPGLLQRLLAYVQGAGQQGLLQPAAAEGGDGEPRYKAVQR
jgi:hypothetical protein